MQPGSNTVRWICYCIWHSDNKGGAYMQIWLKLKKKKKTPYMSPSWMGSGVPIVSILVWKMAHYKETLHRTAPCFAVIVILTHHNQWPHNCCWQWSAGTHHAPGSTLADQPLKITMYVQRCLSDETGQISHSIGAVYKIMFRLPAMKATCLETSISGMV